MSAIAVCMAGDGIVFASDAAAYNSQGIVIGFGTKLYSSPYQDCVWGHVGIGDFGPELCDELGGMRPFDSLMEGIVGKARTAYLRAVDGWIGSLPAPRATMIIGGWSEARAQFELYKLHSSAKEFINQLTGEPGVSPPWELIALGNFWSSSVPLDGDLERFGIDWQSYSPLDLPARYVCANRAGSSSRGDGVYGVGGYLEMSVVTRDGIKNWVAHEWPDVVGEPIDPTRGQIMPAFPLSIPS